MCLGAKEGFGLGKTCREGVAASAGSAPRWRSGLGVRRYPQRRDPQNPSVCFICAYLCTYVPHMRLGKILAQSRLPVPEISGETLGMMKVALRSKGRTSSGFGKRASSHHCLVTPWAPGLRAREHTASALLERSRSTLLAGGFHPVVWH